MKRFKSTSPVKKFAAIAVLLATAIFNAAAVNPYPTLKEKAERNFHFHEWASASAQFTLMLNERPDVPRTYAQAIVSNGMLGNTGEQNRLMAMALENHIPFDSIFTNVKLWSFNIGKPELFERFMKGVRTSHPWMRRQIDAQLLKHYRFRRNGDEMIAYSHAMLDGAPENVVFLTTLAEGHMLNYESQKAVELYKRILEIDPKNRNALINLGNWFAENPTPGESAAGYLTRANELMPTPYVENLIKQLNSRNK